MQSRLKQVQAFLDEKEKECDSLISQHDSNKKELKASKYQLSKLEDESTSTIERLKEEVAELKVECDDLSELVKTKDRMLEDQL